MQPGHALKKLKFDLLIPPQGQEVGMRMVFEQNICNHVVAIVISFNFICNMTML